MARVDVYISRQHPPYKAEIVAKDDQELPRIMEKFEHYPRFPSATLGHFAVELSNAQEVDEVNAMPGVEVFDVRESADEA